MIFFKTPKNQFISQVVVISVIFGFLAGVVGQLFSRAYIDQTIINYSPPELNSNKTIIPELRKVKRFLGTEIDFKISEISEKIKPTLVPVYLKKSGSSNKFLTVLYSEKDFLGNGFILTSDGWLITQGSIVGNNNKEQLAIIIDKKIFFPQNLIIDKLSGIAFMKIDANNLSVVDLGDFQEVNPGQMVLVMNSLGEIIVSNIIKLDYQPKNTDNDFIESSEIFSKDILIKDNLNSTFVGSPIINLGGEIIGIIKSSAKPKINTLGLPVNYFKFVISQLLKNGEIKSPYLGVNYLDLAKVIGLPLNISQGLNKGALVYKKPERTSPASQVGLKINDIITKINGEELSETKNLTEVVQEYRVGDKLILTILRDGQEILLEVYLGAIE